MPSRFPLVCFLIALSGVGYAAEPMLAQAEGYKTRDSWRQLVPPVRIAEHTWHIGTADISAILIKTDAGAILIDGGLQQASDMLLARMKSLDVEPSDLKLILVSHAHADHAGPIAAIKRTTGARVLNNAESAVLMGNGGGNDIHFGDGILYPPVATDRILHDGEIVELGKIRLTAHFIPGHTPGSIAWTWNDTIDGKVRRIAYVDSLTAPGYKLDGNTRYPDIRADFERSFATVRGLPCDLLLTPHADASGWEFANPDNPHPKSMTCKTYADIAQKKFKSQ